MPDQSPRVIPFNNRFGQRIRHIVEEELPYPGLCITERAVVRGEDERLEGTSKVRLQALHALAASEEEAFRELMSRYSHDTGAWEAAGGPERRHVWIYERGA